MRMNCTIKASKEARSGLTKFKSFDFECFAIKAGVTDTTLIEDAFGATVWVRAFGVPPIGRTEAAVKEMAYLVGDSEEVDSSSLSRSGPIRVEIECRDP